MVSICVVTIDAVSVCIVTIDTVSVCSDYWHGVSVVTTDPVSVQ